MPVLNAQIGERPAAAEVRAALGHMAASEAFRGSPQLISFLRYVVEATLRGEQDRIKGYTIAIEALGRGDDFNPQVDPIVRVEATRLRRAINRYYENGGKQDPVQIDLPLGNYVPMFRRGAAQPAPAMLPPPVREWPAARRGRANWRHAALVLFGACLYGGLDHLIGLGPNPQPVPLFLASPSRAATGWRAAPTYPVVFVGAFQPGGKDGANKPVDTLRGKLRDALARFDEIDVISTAPGDARGPSGAESAAAPSQYALTASVESEEAGMASLWVRLTDVIDGRIAYAHTFRGVPPDAELPHGEDSIVREVSAALAQPYGIIQAHERVKDFTGGGIETRYHCLIAAYDYWRNYDPQQHRSARDCLEHATEANPGFALGYAALAQLTLEEYRSGVNARAGEAPALQRALHAARRAVELKPGSARAHQALADVQFARGDYPLAIEAGERAVTLNPYDPDILASYGGMLVLLGEQKRGARLIREAANALVVRPARQDFLLFLTAYLADDHVGAARYAALITADSYPLGFVARAVVAAQRGEGEEARLQLERLAATRPAWRMDWRGELARNIPASAIVDRIERDIAPIRAIPGQ